MATGRCQNRFSELVTRALAEKDRKESAVTMTLSLWWRNATTKSLTGKRPGFKGISAWAKGRVSEKLNLTRDDSPMREVKF